MRRMSCSLTTDAHIADDTNGHVLDTWVTPAVAGSEGK